MGWRIIDSDIADPYFVTAADDAIAQARMEEKIPNTLHFYRRNPAAISVGRSRKLKEDVDEKACHTHNVKIIRRTTGGGSIFTDKDCLIYSLVFDINDFSFLTNESIFKDICNVLVQALQKLDITASYKPPNDILVNGRKISGSAQIKKQNIILIHGTILVNTDLSLLQKVLQNQNPTRVSTLCNESSRSIAIHDIKKTVRKEFEYYFHTTMKKGFFTHYELQLIKDLERGRYRNNAWNFMR